MTATLDVPDGDIAFVEEQIEQESSAQTPLENSRSSRSETIKPIMWRLHFLGGFLAGPIILALCVSGILFAWNPQIDGLRFGDIMKQSSGTEFVSLSDQVVAAQAEYPDWGVFAVTPANDGLNTMVTMDPPGGGRGFSGPDDAQLVYVDPALGAVTGVIASDQTSDSWLRTLHSSLHLGPNAERLTELAGSWFLVSLITGLFLWWPSLRRRGTVAFAARSGVKGRRKDKDWHNFIGVGLLVPMVFLVATGLTWTEYAGDRVDIAKAQLEVPRGGADSELPTPSEGHQSLANIDRVALTATNQGLVEPVQIIVPNDAETGWRVSSRDSTFPVERDQLTVDGASGDVTSSFDYSDEHWFNKLRTAGILFHQAQLFGTPLRVFMTGLTLAIGYLVFTGYRMWWRRRPSGGLGVPPPIRSWIRHAPISVLVAAAVLGYLMPVLAASLAVWLILETGMRWLQILRDPAPATAVHSRATHIAYAAALAIVGTAMIVASGFGEGVQDPGTLHRLGIWMWNWPLGLLLASVGVIGLAAAFRSNADRPDNTPSSRHGSLAEQPTA